MKISFENKNFRVPIKNKNEHLQRYWALGAFYEINMLSYIRDNYKDNLSYVDIGACIGNHTLFFAGIMKAKIVYSFEPVPYIYEFIKDIKEINELNNIIIYNKAISDKNKKEKIKISDYDINIGMSKFDPKGNLIVNAIKLDSIQFENIDIVKIDVENGNRKVLFGAKQTLLKHKPDIFIEADKDFNYVNSYLNKLGYKFTGKTFNRTPTHLFKYE